MHSTTVLQLLPLVPLVTWLNLFQQYAHELLELVLGPGGPRRLTGNADFSLEMLHRASVVAQTRISFSREQLLQLIHEYLSGQVSLV